MPTQELKHYAPDGVDNFELARRQHFAEQRRQRFAQGDVLAQYGPGPEPDEMTKDQLDHALQYMRETGADWPTCYAKAMAPAQQPFSQEEGLRQVESHTLWRKHLETGSWMVHSRHPSIEAAWKHRFLVEGGEGDWAVHPSGVNPNEGSSRKSGKSTHVETSHTWGINP